MQEGEDLGLCLQKQLIMGGEGTGWPEQVRRLHCTPFFGSRVPPGVFRAYSGLRDAP